MTSGHVQIRASWQGRRNQVGTYEEVTSPGRVRRTGHGLNAHVDDDNIIEV
jgi:hypothetical protein